MSRETLCSALLRADWSKDCDFEKYPPGDFISANGDVGIVLDLLEAVMVPDVVGRSGMLST